MFKNVASQKLCVYAFDSTTNLPKTGDAANLTAYVDKDWGGVTILGDTSATEVDATNAKGYYIFDLTQAETSADTLLFSCKSSTANIVVLAMPAVLQTVPVRFTTLVIDANGLADATAVKIGPTGAGSAQTARDIGASVLLSSGTGTGQVSLSSGLVRLSATGVSDILTTAMTESYAADGATATLSQILYAIWSRLVESSITGTAWTLYKLDGSTGWATVTLGDATNPTSVHRTA